MPDVTEVDPTGNPLVDGLLLGTKWTSPDITFSFPTSAADYGSYATGNGELNTFATLSGQAQAASRAGLGMYQAVSGLTFTEVVSNPGTATIRLGVTQAAGGVAYAYFPYNDSEGLGGDAWFSPGTFDAPTMGDYAFMGYLHELGHALGLKHGQESRFLFPALPAQYDAMEYSVMTYRSYQGGNFGYSNEQWGYAQTIMMLDIAAIQELYGADFNTNAGDTTYTFSTTTGEMFVNGVGQGTPGGNRIFRTVWDGFGVDTYDFSNYTTDQNIGLAAGGFSLMSTVQRANLGDGQFAHGNLYNAMLYHGDVRSLIENAFGGSGNDTVAGNQADNLLKGNAGNDSLSGGEGNDTLDGGLGNDTLNGGNGIDTATYASAATAVTVNLANAGAQATGGAGADTLIAIENLTGSAFNDVLTGNAQNNVLSGGDGDDILAGGGGSDFIYGGAGKDTITANNFHGGVFDGGADNDTMIATTFLATMIGGGGVDLLDFRAYNGALNFDMITGHTQFFGESYTEFENLLLGNGANIVTGTNGDNIITGGTSSDTIEGDGGNDVLNGLAGSDTLNGGDGDDTLNGGIGAGNDVLTGGADIDTVTYVTATAAVAVSLLVTTAQNTGGAGTDTITTVENLIGSAFNDTLTGSNADNVLSGGNGDDTINGRGGIDTMTGGGGNDKFYVDNAGDIVFETAGQGTGDRVYASVNYTLGAGQSIEFLNANAGATGLTLTGNELANNIQGNSGNDTLFGGGGADILDGRGGVDTMTGGLGDDKYYVDNAGDVLHEGVADGALDFVYASVDYTLASGEYLERLYANVNTALTLTGNEFTNGIFGASGNDTLNGGAGADTLTGNGGADRMVGGAGIDTLFGNAGADVFVLTNVAADRDVIRDWVGGTDKVEVSAAAFGGSLVAGSLSAAQFVSNLTGLAGDTDQRFIYNTTNGALYFDIDGSVATNARVLIAQFTGNPAVIASDFIIAA